MSNYISPYGFGGVTDAVLDCVADRHGLTADQLAEIIHKNAPAHDEDGDGIYDWIDLHSWDTVLGPAVDEFDNRFFGEPE